LKLKLAAILFLLVGAAAENCRAASPDSDAAVGDAECCENATIKDICRHIGFAATGQVTLKGNTTKKFYGEDDEIRLNFVCTSPKRVSLNLYRASTGSTPLTNSALVGNGLVISAFGLHHKDRRTVNQTSGTFIILNKCGLLKSPRVIFEGMLFEDSQIVPQPIEGSSEKETAFPARLPPEISNANETVRSR
jgi:hypothetical protein